MRIFLVALLAIVFCGLSNSTNAQTKLRSELNKVRVDYRDGRVFQYQPSDPFVRSKLFKTHIGHGGKFYNCDNEECKRDSPYICWKNHHEYDLPPRQRFLDSLNCEIAEIKQRIKDGAGACYKGDCSCSECQQAASANVYLAGASMVETGNVAGKKRRVMDRPQAIVRSKAPAVRNATRVAQSDTEGFGLVKGKIIPESNPSLVQQVRTLQGRTPQTATAKPSQNGLLVVKQNGRKPTAAAIATTSPGQVRTAKNTIMNSFRPSKK